VNVEMGDSSLECDQCGYVAKHSSALTTHYRVHTGKYLYCIRSRCMLLHASVKFSAVNLIKIWMHFLQHSKTI